MRKLINRRLKLYIIQGDNGRWYIEYNGVRSNTDGHVYEAGAYYSAKNFERTAIKRWAHRSSR